MANLKKQTEKKDIGATLIFQKTYTLKNSNFNTKYSAAYALNFFIKPPGSLGFQLLFKCMLRVLYILQILTNSLKFLIPGASFHIELSFLHAVVVSRFVMFTLTRVRIQYKRWSATSVSEMDFNDRRAVSHSQQRLR